MLTTLYRAADYAKAANGRRTTLLLLSDMLNATRELNMERAGGVPDSAWIAARVGEGRVPDLRGVCVVVVGADVRTGTGVAVRRFWEGYLRAAGAEVAEYRNMVSDAGEVGCG